MNKDRSRSAVASDGGQQNSWLQKFTQILLKKSFSTNLNNREQLSLLLRTAEKNNLFDPDALSMIEGVLTVSEMQVRDVMVPRSQMVVISENDTPEEFLPLMVESAHSRFPVVGDTRDEIVGIVLAKDVLAYFAERDEKSSNGDKLRFNLRDMLRPSVFIPESKRLNVLLKDFRANRNHMAIVVDEYGGVAGLVTIEDVLEQIVGDIEDEHDFDEDSFIVKHSDTEYTLKALTPIDEFNENFNAKLKDDEFDTIGGLLMSEFGRLPQRDEECHLGQFHFKVLRADSRRIHLLHMQVLPKDEDSTVETDLVKNGEA